MLLPYNETGKMPKQTDFDELSESEINNRLLFLYKYKHIAIDTRFVQQIDIDSENARDIFIPITDEQPYFLSSSKKLPHIFVNLQNKDSFGKRFTWDEIDSKVEILNGQWSWCEIDAEVINHGSVIHELSIVKKEETKKYNDYTFECTNQSVNVLLEIIDKRFIDDYNVWWRIGSALCNCGYSFEVFDNWSKKGSSYGSTKKIWDSISKSKNESIQLGTICYYAKQSNPVLFNIVKEKLPKKSQIDIFKTFIENESLPTLTHSIVSRLVMILFHERYNYRYAFSRNTWFRLSPGGIYEKLNYYFKRYPCLCAILFIKYITKYYFK